MHKHAQTVELFKTRVVRCLLLHPPFLYYTIDTVGLVDGVLN